MVETKERKEQQKEEENPINPFEAYKVNLLSEIYYSLKIRPLIKKAIESVHDRFGLIIPMPKLELYDVPGNYIVAHLYDDKRNAEYRLIIWSIKWALKADVIPHEIYHEAQLEYRKREGGGDSETPYILKASLRDQEAAKKESALWDGVNEAGAYIFGFGEAYRQEGLEGKELGIKVLQAVVRHTGRPINMVRDGVLDLFFTDKEIGLAEINRMKYDAMPVVAAIILWQNNLDVDKAAMHLLQDPSKTIDEIRKLGRNEVMKILESVERLSKT